MKRLAGVPVLLAVASLGACGVRSEPVPPLLALRGTIHFTGAAPIDFTAVLGFVLALPDETGFTAPNASDWPLEYTSQGSARLVPLRWVRSIRIVSYEGREGYDCLFDALVEIETVTGVRFRQHFRTLEWIKVIVAADFEEGVQPSIRTFAFARDGQANISRIDIAAAESGS